MRPGIVRIKAEILTEAIVNRKRGSVVVGVSTGVKVVHQACVCVENAAGRISSVRQFVAGVRTVRSNRRPRNDRCRRAIRRRVGQTCGRTHVQVLWTNLFVRPKEKIAGADHQALSYLLVDLKACLLGICHPHVVIDSATAVRDKRSLRAGVEVWGILPSSYQSGGCLRRRRNGRAIRIRERTSGCTARSVRGTRSVKAQLIQDPRGGFVALTHPGLGRIGNYDFALRVRHIKESHVVTVREDAITCADYRATHGEYARPTRGWNIR